MNFSIQENTTSKIIEIFIENSTSPGNGLTGLVYNSAGLVCYYIRNGGTGSIQIPLVNMTLGTWVSGGFKEIDATNMPGWYQLGIPNALIAEEVDSASLNLKGATNMLPLTINVQITINVWDEDLIDHGFDDTFGKEVAKIADVRASASSSESLASSGSVIYGIVNSGTYLSTQNRDGTYWSINENGTTGLTVEFTFIIPAGNKSGDVEVFGRYIGNPPNTHHIELQAYNVPADNWELLRENFMPGGNTTDSLYLQEYNERHINTVTNEVKIRLVHHTATYNPSHILYIDFIGLTSIEYVTAGDISDAVWDENIYSHIILDTFGKLNNDLVLYTLNQKFLVESLGLNGHGRSGNVWYWDPYNGSDAKDGTTPNNACKTFAHIHNNLVVDNNYDTIYGLSTNPSGFTIVTEKLIITKSCLTFHAQGNMFQFIPTVKNGNTIAINANNISVAGFEVQMEPTSSNGYGIQAVGYNLIIKDIRVINCYDGVGVIDGSYSVFKDVIIHHNTNCGMCIEGDSDHTDITHCHIGSNGGTGIIVNINTGFHEVNIIDNTVIHGNDGYGINIKNNSEAVHIAADTILFNNAQGNINDNGDATYDGVQETSTVISAAVWDEILTNQTHNINNSAGRRLRQITSAIITSDLAVSATINTISLSPTTAAPNDGAYDPASISIINGTGVGQSRMIIEYYGATRTAIVDRDWKVLPSIDSEYVILTNPGREHVNEGLARGGTANTITLNTLASNYDDVYIGQTIFLRSGTGEDQAYKITAYNGTTKIVTICKDWAVIPDSTTGYIILPTGMFDAAVLINNITNSVWSNSTRSLTDKVDYSITNQNKLDIASLTWDELAVDHIAFDTMGELQNLLAHNPKVNFDL